MYAQCILLVYTDASKCQLTGLASGAGAPFAASLDHTHTCTHTKQQQPQRTASYIAGKLADSCLRYARQLETPGVQ